MGTRWLATTGNHRFFSPLKLCWVMECDFCRGSSNISRDCFAYRWELQRAIARHSGLHCLLFERNVLRKKQQMWRLSVLRALVVQFKMAAFSLPKSDALSREGQPFILYTLQFPVVNLLFDISSWCHSRGFLNRGVRMCSVSLTVVVGCQGCHKFVGVTMRSSAKVVHKRSERRVGMMQVQLRNAQSAFPRTDCLPHRV